MVDPRVIAAAERILALLALLEGPSRRPLSGDRTPYAGNRWRTRSEQKMQCTQPPKQSHGGSRMPAGVRTSDRVPDKRRSLYVYYHWRVERARGDERRLRRLVKEAIRDYEIETGKWRPPYQSNDESFILWMLEEYVGVSAEDVSIRIEAPVRWVRQRRAVNGYDPEYGGARVNDQRAASIASLAKGGASVRAIAEALEISKSTVHRVLSGGG